jgi:hypothetical protein
VRLLIWHRSKRPSRCWFRRIRISQPERGMLQTRTKVLNNELEGVFRRWYPQFRAQAA